MKGWKAIRKLDKASEIIWWLIYFQNYWYEEIKLKNILRWVSCSGFRDVLACWIRISLCTRRYLYFFPLVLNGDSGSTETAPTLNHTSTSIFTWSPTPTATATQQVPPAHSISWRLLYRQLRGHQHAVHTVRGGRGLRPAGITPIFRPPFLLPKPHLRRSPGDLRLVVLCRRLLHLDGQAPADRGWVGESRPG